MVCSNISILLWGSLFQAQLFVLHVQGLRLSLSICLEGFWSASCVLAEVPHPPSFNGKAEPLQVFC